MSEFAIPSEEGLPLRGNLESGDNPRALVVLIHGFKGFKDWGFFPFLAQRLVDHRLAVCRFNMSRSGIGEDDETFDRLDLFADDTYSTQLRDLATVVRHAQERFPSLPTFLLGHSRGGAMAILGAQHVPNLRGVAAWSPIASVNRWDAGAMREWEMRGFIEVENARTKQVMRVSRRVLDDYRADPDRFDVEAAAARLQVPLLVVHGGRDESVPVDEGRLLAAKARDSSLLVIPRASHTYNAIHPLIHVPFELVVATEVSAHFMNAF